MNAFKQYVYVVLIIVLCNPVVTFKPMEETLVQQMIAVEQ